MLKKNKSITILSFFLVLLFFSCDTREKPSCFVGITLCNKDNIESEIVKINTVEKILISEGESTKSTVQVLENVVCSLRNDTISKGEILAYTKSNSDGKVSFCFSEDRNNSEKNCAMYYLLDTAAEVDAQTNGTSKFYIVINDSELDGYDEKYQTLRQTCATSDIYNDKITIALCKR